MKKIFLSLSLATFLGCTSSYPPPAIPAVSATDTTPVATFLVQIPPPTVIYQAAPAPVVSPPETNAAANVNPAERNPYIGSFIIPAKAPVISTTIEQATVEVPGVTITNTPQHLGGAAHPDAVGSAVATNAPGASISLNSTNSNSQPLQPR